MIFTSCSSRSRPNSWRGWKRLPRWQQALPHRRTTELGTGWNPACTLERLLFVYLIDGCTCPARPRPWVRTSRTWNKCQGFHGSPLNGRLASHGPSRCTGTSTKIKPINVDFFHCYSSECVSAQKLKLSKNKLYIYQFVRHVHWGNSEIISMTKYHIY